MRSSGAGTTELLSLALTLNLPSCHVFLSALLSYSLFKRLVIIYDCIAPIYLVEGQQLVPLRVLELHDVEDALDLGGHALVDDLLNEEKNWE